MFIGGFRMTFFCCLISLASVLATADAGSAAGGSFSGGFGVSNGLKFENFAYCDAGLRFVVPSRERDQAAALGQFFGALINSQSEAGNLIFQSGVEEAHSFGLLVSSGRRNIDDCGNIFESRQFVLIPISQARTDYRGLPGLDPPHRRQLPQYQIVLAFGDKIPVLHHDRGGSLCGRSIWHRRDHIRYRSRQFVKTFHRSYFHSSLPLASYLIEPAKSSLARVWLNVTPSTRQCPGPPEYARNTGRAQEPAAHPSSGTFDSSTTEVYTKWH